jgi:hypothetical protein
VQTQRVPTLALELNSRQRSSAPAVLSPEAEDEAHKQRLAHIKEKGWELTPEGWVLDQSDTRWHKQARKVIEYSPDVSFEEGVRAAWNHQKLLEAQELARDQRNERGRR